MEIYLLKFLIWQLLDCNRIKINLIFSAHKYTDNAFKHNHTLTNNVHVFVIPKKAENRPIFYYINQLYVRLSVHLFCIQPKARNYWYISIKFDASTCFVPRLLKMIRVGRFFLPLPPHKALF